MRDIADRRRGLEVRDGIIRGDHKRRSCCVSRNGHGACYICGNPVDELDARVVTGYVEVHHEEDASAGALLVGVFVWNLAGVLHFTMPLTQPLRALHLQQNWGMFAPYPRLDDGWYVAEGQLVSGERVDVFRAVIAGSGEALDAPVPRRSSRATARCRASPPRSRK